MWALKPSPRAVPSPTSSPPARFRTVRLINRDVRRIRRKAPFAHSGFGIRHSDLSFRTPPSPLHIQNVRLFEKTHLIKHHRGPPYKARSKSLGISNNGHRPGSENQQVGHPRHPSAPRATIVTRRSDSSRKKGTGSRTIAETARESIYKHDAQASEPPYATLRYTS